MIARDGGFYRNRFTDDAMRIHWHGVLRLTIVTAEFTSLVLYECSKSLQFKNRGKLHPFNSISTCPSPKLILRRPSANN